MKEPNYKKVAKKISSEIQSRLVVNKPHLIHIIQQLSNTSRKEANDILKTIVIEKKIEEHLALSKKEKPYSFYTPVGAKNNIDIILSPLLKLLNTKKELEIIDASRVSGYSPLIIRTLLTHLLLRGDVDYYGNLDSPIFFIPWDLK